MKHSILLALGIAVLLGAAGCGREYSTSEASAKEVAQARATIDSWIEEAARASSPEGAAGAPAAFLDPEATVELAQITRAGSGILKVVVVARAGGEIQRRLLILTKKDGEYNVTGIM
ncbi:MAG: hypothetical protein QGH74_04480 [Candidatus Brocadiia bacterium]|nr:hypothetical protein [Candidatus Brocadiia bacterium]